MSKIIKAKTLDLDKKSSTKSPLHIKTNTNLNNPNLRSSVEYNCQVYARKPSSTLKNFGIIVSNNKNSRYPVCEVKEMSPLGNRLKSRRSSRYFKSNTESRTRRKKVSTDVKNSLAQSFREIMQKRIKSHRSIINEISLKSPLKGVNLFNKTSNTQKFLKEYFLSKPSSSYATSRKNTKCFETVEHPQNCVSIQTDDLVFK